MRAVGLSVIPDEAVPEMVERVARAIHAEFHRNTLSGRSGEPAADAWKRIAAYDGREEWFAMARAAIAAIAAMREPAEATMTVISRYIKLPDGNCVRRWEHPDGRVIGEDRIGEWPFTEMPPVEGL